MDAGIRFNSQVYVRFIFDYEQATMDVMVEIIDDDGVKHEIPGSVVWDE